ncbi:unnamed protein product [Schistosoma intercalatum]|nr:unnamed protein product [Schistosoma intercalatum]
MSDYVLDGDQGFHGDEFIDESEKEDVGVTEEMHFDAELEAIKERFKEIEADANKLHDLRRVIQRSPISTSQVSFSAAESNNSNMSDEDKTEVDLRSVYVGNVDYGSTADELEAHFRSCGPINRVTILCNKFTGHPKGFAYIEFDTRDAVEAAIALDDSSFRSRQLKVLPKRTNVPGMSMTNHLPFVRGRARGRGMSISFRPVYAGRVQFPRYRRRGTYYFSPY